MLQEDIITNLLGLSNVCVDKIQESDKILHLQLSTKATKQVCPVCGTITSRVHDYRLQVIKDTSAPKRSISVPEETQICMYRLR